MENKICILTTKLHKGDAFDEKWMRLHTENVYHSFHASVNNVFATCGISSTYQFCDDPVDGYQWGGGEDK